MYNEERVSTAPQNLYNKYPSTGGEHVLEITCVRCDCDGNMYKEVLSVLPIGNMAREV